MKRLYWFLIYTFLLMFISYQSYGLSYPIVDTNQGTCFDTTTSMSCSKSAFLGQDAQYKGNMPKYKDNGNGTVTDLVTHLMRQKTPGKKMTYEEAKAGAKVFSGGGYHDWRLPTIKELYSLIDFSGKDPSGYEGTDTSGLIPFINTHYFDFKYGNTSAGERIIDAQYASSTLYVSTLTETKLFGVNFADGRIKGYGLQPHGNQKTFYVIYVRGNSYGVNSFVNNKNGTISDKATGLIWQKKDSGKAMSWKDALAYCENLQLGTYRDWRLPNIKELQSLVDYSRSPDTTSSAAIHSLFSVSSFKNEAGKKDYPYFWSSTTHANMMGGNAAAYISFGRALGYMNTSWVDVHGAGAQRSDPKTGKASDYPTGHGPQGDAIRVLNYVRCVRGGAAKFVSGGTGAHLSFTGGNRPGSGSLSVPAAPQKAIDACKGLSTGASCSIATPQTTIVGSCSLPPNSSQLTCIPRQ